MGVLWGEVFPEKSGAVHAGFKIGDTLPGNRLNGRMRKTKRIECGNAFGCFTIVADGASGFTAENRQSHRPSGYVDMQLGVCLHRRLAQTIKTALNFGKMNA